MRGETYCTKLMSNYLPAFCALVAWPEKLNSRQEEFGILGRLFGFATFIFLRRRDQLAQAVSRLIAADTGICHGAKGQSAYVSTAALVDDDYSAVVIFSYRRMKAELEMIEREEAYLDDLQTFFEIKELRL